MARPNIEKNDAIRTRFGAVYVTDIWYSDKKQAWLVGFTVLVDGTFQDKWEYADEVSKLK